MTWISREMHFDHWPLILGLSCSPSEKMPNFHTTSNLTTFAVPHHLFAMWGAGQHPTFSPSRYSSGFAGQDQPCHRWMPTLREPRGSAPAPSTLPGEPHNTNLLFTFNPWVLAPLPAGKKDLTEGDVLRAPATSVPGRTQPDVTGTILQAFTGAR